MNLVRITWRRDGLTHSVLKTRPVAVAFAEHLLKTYRIDATIESANTPAPADAEPLFVLV